MRLNTYLCSVSPEVGERSDVKMYYYCIIENIKILKIFPLLSFNIMQFLLGTRRYFLRYPNILEMIACGGKEKKVNPKASNCLYIKVPQRTCLPWQPLTWMTFLTRFNFSQFMYRTKKRVLLILTQQMLTEYRKLYNKSM